MLHREHKRPARRKPFVNVLHQRREVPHVVEGQRAEHHVKAARSEGQVLHGGAAVLDHRPAVLFAGGLQHLFGKVHAQHRDRALLGGVGTVPAVTAAQVQHPFARKFRQQLFQLVPFACTCQPLLRASHLAVLFKKLRVVVFVLFHCLFLPCKTSMCSVCSHGFMQFSAQGYRRASHHFLFRLCCHYTISSPPRKARSKPDFDPESPDFFSF